MKALLGLSVSTHPEQMQRLQKALELRGGVIFALFLRAGLLLWALGPDGPCGPVSSVLGPAVRI